MKYVDFTSLYATVNKYDKFPIGHPIIIDFGNIEYFGLAKVKILPSRGMYHPGLPYRANGETENESLCQYTDEQRMFIECWTTMKIHKAVALGYRIVRIYEVYYWKETSVYDPDTGKGDLFAEYVNQFLKIKQMASGLPD